MLGPVSPTAQAYDRPMASSRRDLGERRSVQILIRGAVHRRPRKALTDGGIAICKIPPQARKPTRTLNGSFSPSGAAWDAAVSVAVMRRRATLACTSAAWARSGYEWLGGEPGLPPELGGLVAALDRATDALGCIGRGFNLGLLDTHRRTPSWLSLQCGHDRGGGKGGLERVARPHGRAVPLRGAQYGSRAAGLVAWPVHSGSGIRRTPAVPCTSTTASSTAGATTNVRGVVTMHCSLTPGLAPRLKPSHSSQPLPGSRLLPAEAAS
jgi:hypothetical protein